jgi:hypothetical protein
MRKWLESRCSKSSDLTDQLTESNTKIVWLVLIKKKGKLQFLILWDGLRVGNILEAFGQSFRAVAEVNRIGRLPAFGGCWCGGQIAQVKCSNGVIDWDKVADKFNVGVDVSNNNTVVGVNVSNLPACLDSLLPFPLNNSSNFFFDLKLTE